MPLFAIVLLGCEPRQASVPATTDSTAPLPSVTDSGATPPTTGTPTGDPTKTPMLEASCLPTSNALRFACEVEVWPPQPVRIDFWIAGTSTEYSFTSADVSELHDIVLYMMKSETQYEWRAEAEDDSSLVDSGAFTTDALQGGCAVDSTVSGTSSAPYIISQSPCISGAAIVVLDSDGDVVWCDDFSPGAVDPMMEGYTFTEDGTFLAVLADTIIEKDFEGTELLRLARGTDFANHVHHDVFRKDGLTYLLFNEQVQWGSYTYTLDGFYVFDGTMQVGEWHLIDSWQPTLEPVVQPLMDYSHANSVWVDGNGDLLMSLRHLSGVISVKADPTDPSFGEVNWLLGGNGRGSEFGSDYTLFTFLGGPANFQKQHNAHVLPGGDLAMFDNRQALSENSRVLQMDLDLKSGTAEITEIYELPLHCDFQGGAWHTSIGNPMATCAPSRRGFEWDLGTSTPRWEMELSCGTTNTYTPRFTPWDGPF